MSFEAHIIADSISPADIRIITYQLRYPRFIHAELMTHRVFSRNASSSRAIPVERMIRDLRRDPAKPVFWGSNMQGMQAGEELTGLELQLAQTAWEGGMEDAIKWVESMMDVGLHKQIANRMLEPWGHINVVVTSTEWQNFFTLRRDKDAQPEIKHLADLMWEAREDSTPELKQHGRWHLPYITQEEKDEPIRFDLDVLRKVSVARCARVSYLTHDGRQTRVAEDLELFKRLMGRQPLHASPAEHQATPDNLHYEPDLSSEEKIENWKKDPKNLGFKRVWNKPELHGNFIGWIQFRKTLPGEFVSG